MALVRIESYPTGSGPAAVDVALEAMDSVYAFIYSRVGNRYDAEDLTQQVAVKALPRLRDGAFDYEIKAYLFATARSVLATFWEGRGRIQESELHDNVAGGAGPTIVASAAAEESVAAILERLRPSHRRLLELRFLRGYSIKEVASEMGKTVGAVKVMQLRALREAARMVDLGPRRSFGDGAA